jgi:hypothetical protein
MFDQTATYHKSALGAEAIATRSGALSPKLRSMLILIDGKRGFEELAKLGAMFGDPAQLMAQLAEQNFIEPVASSAAAPHRGAVVPDTGPDSTTTTVTRVTLQEAQRFAVRLLTDMLGPAAEDLCMRIEATRTPQEFLAAVRKAESMMRQFGNPERAERFAAQMESHKPG